MRIAILLGCLALVVGCARTSVMQMSQNQLMLTTSAAPLCGAQGSQKVAQEMAAVETIRHGYDRYIIAGAGSQNNVSVYQTGPTYSNTYGQATVTGNQVYGSSTTYYGGQQTIVAGSHDTALRIVMFRSGEQGYEQAVDARMILGADWQAKVKDGIQTC